MIRVVFEAKDSGDLIAWAKELLEAQGLVVKRPEELHAKEAPQQFCDRIGISIQTWCRKVRLASCPQNYECERTATGRFIWLRASKELEEFMKPLIGGKKDA